MSSTLILLNHLVVVDQLDPVQNYYLQKGLGGPITRDACFRHRSVVGEMNLVTKSSSMHPGKSVYHYIAAGGCVVCYTHLSRTVLQVRSDAFALRSWI